MHVRYGVMGLCALVLQSYSAVAHTVGHIVFPSEVNPQFSNMSAGRAIRETCLEQFSINKANNANGGLHFVQKGGGYLTKCSKHLQGHH
jgi:hypothetical protein